MNLGKPGVSFARSPGADRYPSELTRAGSVLGRPMEIVRLRAKGGAGGGGTRRRRVPAAERGWELAGDGDRGVAGLYMSRGLAQEHRSGMGSALGCLGRRWRAGGMALDGEAALGAGNSPETADSGLPVAELGRG